MLVPVTECHYYEPGLRSTIGKHWLIEQVLKLLCSEFEGEHQNNEIVASRYQISTVNQIFLIEL